MRTRFRAVPQETLVLPADCRKVTGVLAAQQDTREMHMCFFFPSRLVFLSSLASEGSSPPVLLGFI